MKKSPSVATSSTSKPGFLGLLRRIFLGELRLSFSGRRLHISWGETQPDPGVVVKKRATPSANPKPSKTASSPLAVLRSELAAALDAKPGHRKTFVHLVVFEAALTRLGLRVFDELPVTALSKAHDQLELLLGLLAATSGLHRLVGQMADAIARRTGNQASMMVPANLSNTSRLEISEARMSDFYTVAGEAVGPGVGVNGR